MVMYASGMIFFLSPTKLGNVGHHHRLSLTNTYYVYLSFFLGSFLVIFSVQILVPLCCRPSIIARLEYPISSNGI